MRAGSLRNWLTVQHLVDASPGELPEGETTRDWLTFTETWGSVMPQGGRELFAAAAENRETTVIIRTRYFPGLTTAMRIVFDDKYYNIKNIVNFEEMDVEYILACEEGKNLG